MTDEKPTPETSKPTSQLADDEPDPTVQAPALVWMYKSYKSEKETRDGAGKTDETTGK